MFLKLFRSQYIFQIIIVLLIAMVLWVEAFISSMAMPQTNSITPLYSVCYFWLADLKLLSVIVAFLFIIYEALYVNKILTDNKLIPRNTFLPAFIFILLMSYNTLNLSLNPLILSLAFLMPAFSNIVISYEKPESYTEIFNAGLLVSVASLFYFPALGYFLLLWTGLYVFRIFKWREWIIALTGLVLPYLFLLVYYFISDQVLFFFSEYAYFLKHSIGSNFSLTNNDGIYILALSLVNTIILLLAISNILRKMNEKVITQRKKISLILVMMFISLFTFIYRDEYASIQKMFITFPMTLILAIFFANIRRSFINELIFTLMVVLLLAGRIFM